MSELSEKKRFGAELREFRERNRMARDDFAPFLGITSKTLAQVELGYQNLGTAAKRAFERLKEEGIGIAERASGYHAPPYPGIEPRKNAASGIASVDIETLEKIVDRAVELALDPEIRKRGKAAAAPLGCSDIEAIQLIALKEIRNGTAKGG